jgi:hypothetical protein
MEHEEDMEPKDTWEWHRRKVLIDWMKMGQQGLKACQEA